MNKVFIFFILVIIVSCADEGRLESALGKSGDNRRELEKVLDHYARDKADSLKLRAARFLIENMPGHYTYTGDYIESYKEQLDSLNPGLPLTLKSHLYSMPTANPFIAGILERRYDIEHISGDFLIKHIDYKFRLRDITPWGDKISFEDFCEYLLPYRVDREPLPDIPQERLDARLNKLDSIFASMKDCNITIFEFKEFIGNKMFDYANAYKSVALPFGKGRYEFDCVATAYNLMEEYRAMGIPASIDFTPHWAADDNRHSWNNYVDPYGKQATVNYISGSKMAKIYRKTYSSRPCPLQDSNFIPAVFTPFVKDVTGEYIKTRDVGLKYEDCAGKGVRNVYLSVFNQQKWREVSWSELEDGDRAEFKDMGTDIVYLPTYYAGEEQVVAGYPFHLGVDGKIKKMIPGDKALIRLRLERKYPKDLHKVMWEENIAGAVIEASDDQNFLHPDTVYMITDRARTSIYRVGVGGDKKYRFFRIVQSPQRLKMFIAGWRFTDEAGKELQGKVITPAENSKKELPEDYLTRQKELEAMLYDKDVLSYITMIGWIGVDFGKPVNIKTVEIMLRNDGNGICPGDIYELLYHGRQGWNSLGTKQAADRYIEFDNVPSGALYWLRNLSKGKEERTFTYEDGKTVFW